MRRRLASSRAQVTLEGIDDDGPEVVRIIQSDYYNAVYFSDTLANQAKPERLDAESLIRTHQALGITVELYVMPSDVYDEVLNGEGYPASFDDLPVDRLNKIEVA